MAALRQISLLQDDVLMRHFVVLTILLSHVDGTLLYNYRIALNVMQSVAFKEYELSDYTENITNCIWVLMNEYDN